MGKESLYTFPLLDKYASWLGHFVSTRHGGYSHGAFQSLNIGLHVGDDDANVIKNRRALSEKAGYDYQKAVYGNQDHSCNIRIIESKDAGRGHDSTKDAFQSTDAFITNQPGICLNVMMADCVPVLIVDVRKKVVAAVHAGWRGTVQQITLHTVLKMQSQMDCNPQDLCALIGPSIGPCCYEVGEDVATGARGMRGQDVDEVLKADGHGKYIFDQWLANKQQLILGGISPSMIEISGICSCCNHEDFFSSRHDKGLTGRFSAGIWIKE